MGEMADYYAEMASTIPDWMMDGDHDRHGPNNRFDEFRTDVWETKDGQRIAIREMTDKHLLAAFKMFGDKRLGDEMLIRMFEATTKPKISF